jgi:hypothetical protein
MEEVLSREEAASFENDIDLRQRFQIATQVITKHREDLIRSFPLVTAVAVSLKYFKGDLSRRDPCVTFFVAEKLPADRMRMNAIPPTIDGAPTDVVEGGTPVLFASRPHTPGQRSRPAQPGSSVSHFNVTSGTFGCLVTDGEHEYVLSCAHVLSHATGSAGDAVLQPGTSFGGTAPTDQIASLTKAILGSGPFIADAAIAKIDDPSNVTADVRGIGKPTGPRTLNGVGFTVQKSGDVSGVTHGVVVGLKGTVGPLQINGFANVYFNDVIITTGMSQPGDSGSLLMDYRNRAIGVLFGGLQFGSSYVVSWYSPIETVLQSLGVNLVI